MTEKADWITEEDIQIIKDEYSNIKPNGILSLQQIGDIISQSSFMPLKQTEEFEFVNLPPDYTENTRQAIIKEWQQIESLVKDVYMIKSFFIDQSKDDTTQIKELTLEQAQQENEILYAYLIHEKLLEKKTIKEIKKNKLGMVITNESTIYQLTTPRSIPTVFTKIKLHFKNMNVEYIYSFLKTIKDEKGESTNDAVNTLKSRNKKPS